MRSFPYPDWFMCFLKVSWPTYYGNSSNATPPMSE